MKRILFPTDMSETHLKALRYAALFCRQQNAVLHVLNVSWPTNSSRRPLLEEGSYLKQKKAELEAWVTRNLKSSKKIIFHAAHGNVLPAILEYVETLSADLIIIPRRSRYDYFDRLMGSRIHRLVRSATVPVLVLPPRIRFRRKPKVLSFDIDERTIREMDLLRFFNGGKIVYSSWVPLQELRRKHKFELLFGKCREVLKRVFSGMIKKKRGHMLLMQWPHSRKSWLHKIMYTLVFIVQAPVFFVPPTLVTGRQYEILEPGFRREDLVPGIT